MPINATKIAILSFPRHIKRSVVLLSDVFICICSVWFSFGLRIEQWGMLQGNQWYALFLALGLSVPLFVYCDFYRAIFRHIDSVALASMGRIFAIYSALFFCIITFVGLSDVPRSIGVIQPILFYIGIRASRYIARAWLGEISNIQKLLYKTKPTALIYGAGSAGRQLAAGLAISGEILVKGFVDDDVHLHGNSINGVDIYKTTDLQTLIIKLEITDVLLALPSIAQQRRNEIIASLSNFGIRVRTLPGLMDIAFGRVRIADLRDLDMNDLLGRKVVPPAVELLEKNIKNKSVLVTGAGGSIGSELCRQIIKFSPSSLIVVDSSEHSLYLIYEEIKRLIIEGRNEQIDGADSDCVRSGAASFKLTPCLASVRDGELMLEIFNAYQPFIVFHAAAYKHVPLVEQNPSEGISNNVLGTLSCAEVSMESGVSHFVLISTDKAVRPTNIMGASKRIAEMVLQALSDLADKKDVITQFSMVRFGNVLGSSGSVAPLFAEQIKSGGPITLTHSDVTRYFMTIPEAAQLVIQASAMATGGDVFVLDMGEPIRVYDLAAKMIYLSGLVVKDEQHPLGDIEIKVTGLRSGEKLYEELLIGNNPQLTEHPKIMKAHEDFLPWDDLQLELENLKIALETHDSKLIKDVLKRLVPGYQPSDTPIS